MFSLFSIFFSTGFISINSFRTSSQSYSKRSSDFSFQSSTKSSNSSTDVAYLSTENNGIPDDYTKCIHQSTKTTASGISTFLNSGGGKLPGQVQLISSEGNDQKDRHNCNIQLLESHNNSSMKEFTSVSPDLYTLGKLHSPPALPPKTIRSNNSTTREGQILPTEDIFDSTDNFSSGRCILIVLFYKNCMYYFVFIDWFF